MLDLNQHTWADCRSHWGNMPDRRPFQCRSGYCSRRRLCMQAQLRLGALWGWLRIRLWKTRASWCLSLWVGILVYASLRNLWRFLYVFFSPTQNILKVLFQKHISSAPHVPCTAVKFSIIQMDCALTSTPSRGYSVIRHRSIYGNYYIVNVLYRVDHPL
jgi:hypothetical protein